MNPLFVLIGVLLAVGLWGYFQSGDVLYVMNKLATSDIATVAQNAGFTDVVTAVSIALAESSGDPQAVGDNGTSYGLWQIHFTVHPEVLQGADPSTLFDPQNNANAAFKVYQEQGWSAWTTYKTGAYQEYIAEVQSDLGLSA